MATVQTRGQARTNTRMHTIKGDLEQALAHTAFISDYSDEMFRRPETGIVKGGVAHAGY